MMRRARLSVRPNISIRGDRSVTAKPVVSVTEPAVTSNEIAATANDTVVTANDTVVTANDTVVTANDPVVTANDPVVTVIEPELQEGEEQVVVPQEPRNTLKVEEVAQTVAVQHGGNNVDVKCSLQKLDTTALSVERSTGTNTVNVLRRRNRLKPLVSITRKQTCPVDLERVSSDKQSPRNDADGRIPPVAQDGGHRLPAEQQQSKDKIDESATCPQAQPLKVAAEDTLNGHVEHLGTVDKEKACDLVKVSSTSGDETKPLSSPKVGKAAAALRRAHFPKARPNLVDTGRHVRIRAPSLSDAEEEGGKMQGPPSVQRVASLSPANARLVEVGPDSRCGEVFVPLSCSNITEPTDQCSKMEDIVETTQPEDTLNKTLMSRSEKKQVMRKKRRKMGTLAEGVDRSKLTMRDLIYMNPIDNPMKSTVEEAERRRKIKAEERVRKQEADNPKGDNPKEESVDDAEADVANVDDLDNDDVIELEDETHSVAGTEKSDAAAVSETKGDEEEEEDEALVPQVTIGPDGNIVINMSSLTVETDKTKGKEQDDWDIVTEEFSSTAQAYGRKPPSRLWKLNETKKFYVALSTVGTDFSLMCNLFPKRSRVELKRKFKREEKQNKHLVDTALMERRGFDVTLFEELSSDENEEIMKEKKMKKTKKQKKNEKENEGEPKKRKESEGEPKRKESEGGPKKRKRGKNGGQNKKKRKTKKSSKYYDDSSSESEVEGDTSLPEQNGLVLDDNDDSHTTIAKAESNDEEEAEIMKGLCRTTRYGRKPRPVKTYEAATAPNPHQRVKRIGSKPADVTVTSPGHILSPSIAAPSSLVSPGHGMFARSPSGHLISLATLGQSSPIADMATSQFVFVTSPPKPNPDGSASEQVIHVYVVSNANAASPGSDHRVVPSIEPSPSVPDGV